MDAIRLARLSERDLPFLHALLNEKAVMDAMHRLPTAPEVWREAFAAWERDPDEENDVILSGPVPVGFLKLNGLADRPDAWLSTLAVSTAYQHRGVGSRAIALAETLLRGRGYRTLRIHTNEDNAAAQSCYRKLGYRQTERSGCTNADGASRVGHTYVKTLAPDWESVKSHWGAYAYEHLETQTDDADCLVKLLGSRPLRILEVCCGGGRLLVPLARAGHTVVGFDRDEDMLASLAAKAAGLDNIRWHRADALESDWGDGFDTAVLAGNILINIETDGDYEAAQRTFLCKAARAVKPGGLVYLDFNLYARPETFFGDPTPRTYFEITDDAGVRGRFGGSGGTYDARRQLAVGKRHTVLTLPGGETEEFLSNSVKFIPTLSDVRGWLSDAGLAVGAEYGGYDLRPVGDDTCRAVILAGKPGAV